ncbi:Transmembrane anterior posterior transformation protein 1-like protein [Frankliniella fusca]|uniref:Transmembrane anterior posterior transformation protein 1-like protein n=1 Tax=Frankliniella fusca TaxID=407009 RepID=A0AAE1LKE1_9NEOP|nr:Transmembrane anterior posterior transformation protein 1-like protein [Frankliniella fusca]
MCGTYRCALNVHRTSGLQLPVGNQAGNQAKASVLKLRVTNDCAERSVALVEEYNKILTADEEQKQFLILDVKEHRKRYPNVNKTTLGKMKENV